MLRSMGNNNVEVPDNLLPIDNKNKNEVWASKAYKGNMLMVSIQCFSSLQIMM